MERHCYAQGEIHSPQVSIPILGRCSFPHFRSEYTWFQQLYSGLLSVFVTCLSRLRGHNVFYVIESQIHVQWIARNPVTSLGFLIQPLVKRFACAISIFDIFVSSQPYHSQVSRPTHAPFASPDSTCLNHKYVSS